MSTNSQPTGSTTVQRRQKDGKSQTEPCPPNVVVYNKFMEGVGKCDQLRGYYRVRVKLRKFYRYIFCFLFDCCVVNAFTLVKHFSPTADSSRHRTSGKSLPSNSSGSITQGNDTPCQRHFDMLQAKIAHLLLNKGEPKQHMEATATFQ